MTLMHNNFILYGGKIYIYKHALKSKHCFNHAVSQINNLHTTVANVIRSRSDLVLTIQILSVLMLCKFVFLVRIEGFDGDAQQVKPKINSTPFLCPFSPSLPFSLPPFLSAKHTF